MLTRNRYTRHAAVFTLFLVAASAIACAKKQDTTTTESTTPPPATESAPAALNDANIAAIVVAANTADVKNGELAKSKTQNPEVKALAEQMVTDHTSVNRQATELVTKLNVTPEDNDTSRQLTSSGDATRESLQAKQGAEFDKAYVDNEVAYHEAVMNMLDQTLIPSAQNAELKGLLESARPVFVAHLDHAKKVQSDLSK